MDKGFDTQYCRIPRSHQNQRRVFNTYVRSQSTGDFDSQRQQNQNSLICFRCRSSLSESESNITCRRTLDSLDFPRGNSQRTYSQINSGPNVLRGSEIPDYSSLETASLSKPKILRGSEIANKKSKRRQGARSQRKAQSESPKVVSPLAESCSENPTKSCSENISKISSENTSKLSSEKTSENPSKNQPKGTQAHSPSDTKSETRPVCKIYLTQSLEDSSLEYDNWLTDQYTDALKQLEREGKEDTEEYDDLVEEFFGYFLGYAENSDENSEPQTSSKPTNPRQKTPSEHPEESKQQRSSSENKTHSESENSSRSSSPKKNFISQHLRRQSDLPDWNIEEEDEEEFNSFNPKILQRSNAYDYTTCPTLKSTTRKATKDKSTFTTFGDQKSERTTDILESSRKLRGATKEESINYPHVEEEIEIRTTRQGSNNFTAVQNFPTAQYQVHPTDINKVAVGPHPKKVTYYDEEDYDSEEDNRWQEEVDPGWKVIASAARVIRENKNQTWWLHTVVRRNTDTSEIRFYDKLVCGKSCKWIELTELQKERNLRELLSAWETIWIEPNSNQNTTKSNQSNLNSTTLTFEDLGLSEPCESNNTPIAQSESL